MFRALSKRSVTPTCAETSGIAEDPLADYVWLVDHVGMPPWVATRSVDCLMQDFGSEAGTAEAMLRWVASPKDAAVGYYVLDHIDALPETVAVQVAAKAVAEGPDPKEAKKRVKASSRAAVRNAGK